MPADNGRFSYQVKAYLPDHSRLRFIRSSGSISCACWMSAHDGAVPDQLLPGRPLSFLLFADRPCRIRIAWNFGSWQKITLFRPLGVRQLLKMLGYYGTDKQRPTRRTTKTTGDAPRQAMTLAAYARRVGVSPQAIYQAIGRGDVRTLDNGLIDVAQADDVYGPKHAARVARINDNQTTRAKREAAKANRTTAKMELMERQETHLTKRTVDRKASQRRVESFHDQAASSTFHPARKRVVWRTSTTLYTCGRSRGRCDYRSYARPSLQRSLFEDRAARLALHLPMVSGNSRLVQ